MYVRMYVCRMVLQILKGSGDDWWRRQKDRQKEKQNTSTSIDASLTLEFRDREENNNNNNNNNNNIPQLRSSEPSPQSLSPSHCHRFGIHLLLSQRNATGEHVLTASKSSCLVRSKIISSVPLLQPALISQPAVLPILTLF